MQSRGRTAEVSRRDQIGNKIFQETKHCIGRIVYVVIEITNFNMCGERRERDNEPGVAMSRNEGK